MNSNTRENVVRSFDGSETFILPRNLNSRHTANCRVLPDRYRLLEHMKKDAIVAEVGTQRGDFAKSIISICEPRKLHIIEYDFQQKNMAFDEMYFENYVSKGQVSLHEGDSSIILSSFPDNYFDWVYIDADHSYEGVCKDIQQAKNKVKASGFILFNDYTIYSPLEKIQYGVQRAVNDLMIDENYEAVYFALNIASYHDICIRKIS